MRNRLLGILIAFLLLIVAFSGCFEDKDVETANKIKEDFLEAVNSVTSYRYIASGTMTRMMTNDSGTTVIMEAPYSVNCDVDITNKQMNMEMTVNVTGGGEIYSGAEGEQIMNYYFEGDTMYTGYGDNRSWSTWGGDNIWYSYAMLERQAYFILNGSTVERIDDETINGIDCYVLNITPIISKLELKKSSTDFLFPQGFSPEKYLEVVIKYWIDKNTNLLKKAYIKSLNNVTISWDSFGQNITKDILLHETELIFYDYNVPLTVEPPWQDYVDLAEETLSHLEYINFTYGYGFNPPEGWVKDDIYGGQFEVRFYIEGIPSYNLSFSVRPLVVDIFHQEDENLSSEVARLLEYYTNDSTENVTLISHSERIINGMDAHEFVVSSIYYGTWKIKTVYVEKGDRLFELKYTTPPEDYDTYESIINESIESFIMISPYYQIDLW